jgi:decaprenylphospho-beta-D-ribofuranose 2-oxidase
MRRSDVDAAVLRQSRFVTFDGSLALSTDHQRPDRYRHLEVDLGARKRIARGAGLSYAAASFGAGVVVQEMTAFNRLLAFDDQNHTIKVEGGITLERLLAWAEPRGLYCAVLPGYPLITVGGCIAADAHGKNPARDGTFCDWVEAMTLFHPRRGFQSITRTSHPELFGTTCGGFGMTGVIVDATLRLSPLLTRNVRVRSIATESLAECAGRLQQESAADFAYSWHDGAARGPAFGRGVLLLGNWTEDAADEATGAYAPMSSDQRGRWPISLWNRLTVRSANALFRRMAVHRPSQVKTAFDAAFPFARQTLYHRFYGRRGLAEAQILVPDAAVPAFIAELSALVHMVDPPLVMMSLKLFQGRQHSLSMSGRGTLFALDLVRCEATRRFLDALDRVVVSTGAQPNIAKDSRLGADTATRALPFHAQFRARLMQLDPDRLYQSELSQRLGL